ncbi:MAG TPA: UDP-N-acetylmuramoyl-tripeptide--D-alanyl-D-alanine ligase [Rhodothermales bacterium]|nr:UDP-N-acetylmuramoyl-tripeptide--D-alanyl-D-alanine ligase [Rhodothermales bacterium]
MPYSTDTRTLQPGDVYVAIRGETHDGHAFIPQAVAKGAAGVVTAVDVAPDVAGAAEVIRVDDTLRYLIEQAIAKVRRQAPAIVAITGSVGKTTTRTAVHAVLSETFEVVASVGNMNTPLGLSLLLLNRDFGPQTKLVLEMGARLEGDIRELCSYFPPTVALVTNVKGVHVETFGSIDGVAREKSELVRALGPTGTACLNGDDPRVRAMAALHTGPTLLYGLDPRCDVGPDRITATLPMLGAHAVYTALAAMSVGLALGMDEATINRGLAQIKPEKGRLNRLRGRGGTTLIDDSYNASPDATRAALDVLRTHAAARRVAFLGDMLELGATEIEAHAGVLEAAVEAADEVHAVGPLMARAVATLPTEVQARISTHATAADVAEALDAGRLYMPAEGDVVLVKGSQGIRMERVAAALLHPDLDPAVVLPRQSESWQQVQG